MPYRAKIADVERSIEELLASMVAMRAKGATIAAIDPMLGQLARLRAERLRLLEHQRLASE